MKSTGVPSREEEASEHHPHVLKRPGGDPRYWHGSRWYQRTAQRARIEGGAWLPRLAVALLTLSVIWLLFQFNAPLPAEEHADSEVDPASSLEEMAAEQPPSQISAPAQTAPTLEPRPTAAAAPVQPTSVPLAQPTSAPTGQATATATPEQTEMAPGLGEAPGQQESRASPEMEPLDVAVSASPASPIGPNAFVVVTISVKSGGAPVDGALCKSDVVFRTVTERVPSAGVFTGPDGAAAFLVDARGASYDYPVRVQATCSAGDRSATAETRFTPVRARG